MAHSLWQVSWLQRFAIGFVATFVFIVPARSMGTELIGVPPSEIIERYGAPDRLFVEQTASDADHFVVFLYADYRYFYFFENEVWQMRVDERSQHSLYGVSIGDMIENVAFEIGAPEWNRDSGESASFTLSGHDHPLELRVYVDGDGMIYDIYLYRMDF